MINNQCISSNKLIVIFILLCGVSDLLSQEPAKTEVQLKKGMRIAYRDTSWIIRKDTTIFVADSSIVKIQKGLFIRLFNNYLVVDKTKAAGEFIEPAGYNDQSAWYIGKVIGDIQIKRLDVFGTTITDTAFFNTNRFTDIGNTLHIKTRSRIIRNNLLFREGDVIAPFMLGDSERLLRALPYVRDSRIYAVPRNGFRDTIDIHVVEKDIWSINLNLRFPEADAVKAGINEVNLLGWGHQLQNNFLIQLNEPLEYESRYSVPNILGSFTSGELSLVNSRDLNLLRLRIRKDFVATEIKYGGGLDYQRFDGLDVVYDLPDSLELPVGFHAFNGWIGRSFRLDSKQPKKTNRSLVLGLGTYNTFHFDRPEITTDSTIQYQNRSLWLGSVTFSQRNFFKNNYVFGFGKTEDIPSGFRWEVTGGYEHGEFVDRYYGGLSFSHAHFLEKFGYLSNAYEVSGFWNGGGFEQSLAKLSSLYFTRLLGESSAFRQRFFLGLRCTLGFRRRTNEVISIDDLNGIRGLKSIFLRGKSSVVINFSHLIFTPWKPFGFQTALAASFDLGYITEPPAPLFFSRPYTGFGLAVKVNNEDLVFGIIQLSLNYFPAPPKDAGRLRIGGGSTRNLQFDNLIVRPPNILKYGN